MMQAATWLDTFTDYVNLVDDKDWGTSFEIAGFPVPLLIILILFGGIWLTIRLGGMQFLQLPRALKYMLKNEKVEHGAKGEVSSLGARCTALSATIGTGNIVGGATAYVAGGPGAIFWMWLAALFGMATKYSEGLLAVKYREHDEATGHVLGGPFYYIERGMGPKWKWLACLFAFFGVLVGLFGIGTFPQVNAIVDSVELSFGFPKAATDAILTFFIAAITIGGLQSIARVASKIIPFMALFYVAICIGLIVVYIDQLPAAIALILEDAFTGQAAVGGFAGSTIMMAMQNGIARGVFSNESGLGSAPIAAAAAKTKWPAEQGLISMTGTFIDTIIICTMTGLALVLTGVWHGDAAGAAMTNSAFMTTYGTIGGSLLTLSLVLFAFTTILGWNYYGERACIYLFGTKGVLPYRLIFIVLVASGAFLKLEAIWILADIVNGLIAIPNLIALIALSGVIVAETKKYMDYRSQPQKADKNQYV